MLKNWESALKNFFTKNYFTNAIAKIMELMYDTDAWNVIIKIECNVCECCQRNIYCHICKHWFPKTLSQSLKVDLCYPPKKQCIFCNTFHWKKCFKGVIRLEVAVSYFKRKTNSVSLLKYMTHTSTKNYVSTIIFFILANYVKVKMIMTHEVFW